MNEIETMFSARVKPWHGLGAVVNEAPDSKTALRLAGLDWRVEQKDVYTEVWMMPERRFCLHMIIWHSWEKRLMN